MERVSHRTCPICEASCGLEIRHAEGRILGIRGHEADVFSRGYVCPKGVALKDLHEDPDRLRRPLLKRGGEFAEVAWDEAFAEIERRLPPILERHGREAAALVIGNPTVHSPSLILYVSRLGKALGSPNIFSASTLDQMPKQLACGLMFGTGSRSRCRISNARISWSCSARTRWPRTEASGPCPTSAARQERCRRAAAS